jgi:CD63 antigen
MVDGGMTCVKYLLFAFNLVFVIFGILLIYAGFTAIASIKDYQLLIQDTPNNVAVTLIIVGFFIFFIAFLGCCGAIRENYCMLVSFSVIILAILLIELIGSGLILAFKSKLRKLTEDGFSAAILKYNNTDPSIDSVIDDIQQNLDCCGANNYSDWDLNPRYKGENYPYSCCNETHNQDNLCKFPNVYTIGCVDKIDNEIRGSVGLLGGIGIAVAVIQLIGIVFACSLSRTVKKEYEVV